MAEHSYSVPKSDRLPEAYGHWSPVVVADPGKLVFISGMTSRDRTGEIVGEGDWEAQTRQICENIKAAVEAAGGGLENITAITAFVTDVAHFETITRVRREYFPTQPPSSTMVEVSRFIDERCLLELNAVAVVPER